MGANAGCAAGFRYINGYKRFDVVITHIKQQHSTLYVQDITRVFRGSGDFSRLTGRVGSE